jgi:hypothetical protein
MNEYEKCKGWDDHNWAHITSLKYWTCLSCGMKTNDTTSAIFQTGIAVNDFLEKTMYVKLDRFCSVHEDGSIYIPAEISTYWELVHMGIIEQEYSNCLLEFVKA